MVLDVEQGGGAFSSQAPGLPHLFGVAQLDVGALFSELRVSLQEVDPPAGVFLQILKLILKQQINV